MFIYEPGRIYQMDVNGNTVAELTYVINNGIADINHTFVDDSLRGQGIAGQLVQAAADTLRKQHVKITNSCSYAAGWFDKHPEQQDLLA
ncbi:MAG: N-acetyltransferase [Oscillospiraceae bacterium]|nr:N-acetyltransferase [Oscillospiraceae bacterium]